MVILNIASYVNLHNKLNIGDLTIDNDPTNAIKIIIEDSDDSKVCIV